MFLRIYSFVVLIYDVIYLLFGCAWAIIESVYQFLRPPKEKSLIGERVLVAGAGKGLGREIALQFAALGAEVVCWDVNSERNESTKQLIVEQGRGRAVAYSCDITERDQVLTTAKRVRKEVGDISIIVHCCSLPSPRLLETPKSQTLQKTMNINVFSHFLIFEAFLPQMQKNNYGHIIALTSVAGLKACKDYIPMCASQFAVQGLIEALAEELRTTSLCNNIFVTLVRIYPFVVSSELLHDTRLRIPSCYGIIDSKNVAHQIITAMRRNYSEISIPGYLFYLGNILRLMPRKVSLMFRDLLNTGVDFG